MAGKTSNMSVDQFHIEVLESSHISVTDKEIDRLDKISDHEGLVNRSLYQLVWCFAKLLSSTVPVTEFSNKTWLQRDEFIEFARKSSSVKVRQDLKPLVHVFHHQEYVEKGKVGVGGGGGGGAPPNLDKAELAFKVSQLIYFYLHLLL